MGICEWCSCNLAAQIIKSSYICERSSELSSYRRHDNTYPTQRLPHPTYPRGKSWQSTTTSAKVWCQLRSSRRCDGTYHALRLQLIYRLTWAVGSGIVGGFVSHSFDRGTLQRARLYTCILLAKCAPHTPTTSHHRRWWWDQKKCKNTKVPLLR